MPPEVGVPVSPTLCMLSSISYIRAVELLFAPAFGPYLRTSVGRWGVLAGEPSLGHFGPSLTLGLACAMRYLPWAKRVIPVVRKMIISQGRLVYTQV